MKHSSRSTQQFRASRYLQRAALAALAMLVLAGCKDTKALEEVQRLSDELALAVATRDSLETLVSGNESAKALASVELAEASKFAEQIDAELRQVRELSSKVQPQAGDESGKAQANAARADILARLKQLRQRLNSRQAQLSRTRDSLVALRGESSAAAQLITDLQARLELRDREILAFESQVRELREVNVQLTYEKAAVTDTMREVEKRANRVYYTIGTKQELLDRKVVSQEGGSRALLVVRLGQTLVPARTLEAALFTMADKREIVTIPLPRADKDYRIVSRHNAKLLEADRMNDDGSFRGTSIRITDPQGFWSASPYLIIVEK